MFRFTIAAALIAAPVAAQTGALARSRRICAA